MTEKNIKLRILLDEGVPISVGEFFESDGHEVIYFNQALTKGATDQVVCTVAEANDAILVACDSDMKGVARKQGISGQRFKKLSLIKLSCKEPHAKARVSDALSFIKAEWERSEKGGHRRVFLELADRFLKTNR